MIAHTLNTKYEFSRKQALWLISRYLRFLPEIKKNILKDMIEMKLIEKVSRDNLRVINLEKSKDIEVSLLGKIVKPESKPGKLTSMILYLFLFTALIKHLVRGFHL